MISAVVICGAYFAISDPPYSRSGQVTTDGRHSIGTIVVGGHTSHSRLDPL